MPTTLESIDNINMDRNKKPNGQSIDYILIRRAKDMPIMHNSIGQSGYCLK